MSESVSLRKLADISPTAMIKSSSQTIKGLLVIIAIGLIGFAVWRAYIKKPVASQSQTTTIQKPGQVSIDQRQILIETERDTFFFGLRLWRIKLGVSLLQKVKTQEQKSGIR